MQQIQVPNLKTRNQGGTVVITVPKSSGIKANQLFDFTKSEDGTLVYKPVTKEKDYWKSLNETMSDEDIAEMHKQIVEDLGYNPNDVESVGHERWWLDE